MEVGCGPKGTRPTGRLPVFTTNTEKAARLLIVLACPLNYQGKHYAPELALEQTSDNLQAFSDRLSYIYENHIKDKDQ